MGTIKTVDFERSGLSKGIKIAALVLILTAAAMTTDHMAFVGASTRPAAAPMVAQPATVTAPAVDGFALPESLRPTSADVDTAPPSF